MKKVILMAMTICLALSAAFAQSAENIPYESMVNQLKAGKTDIDYKALRLAYTKTSDYNPRGIDPKVRGSIAEMLRNKKYQEVITAADAILKTNFVDMDAHVFASMAYAELKDAKKATLHEAIYIGLINSIIQGVNGEDAKTAYEIISLSEEFSVLQALEYSRKGQTIIEENGQKYGVVAAVDQQTKGEVRIYFNINNFANRLPQGQ